MKYEAISSSLFINNRKKLSASLGGGSLAVLHSNDLMPRNGDQQYPFRQNSDLFYLTGIDQEDTILILYPDCPNPKYREALFIRSSNELLATWEGHKYTQEEATQASGIKEVYFTEHFNEVLPALMAYCKKIYINTNENDRAASQIAYRDIRFGKLIREQYPAHNVERLAPIMHRLRAEKSDQEVELCKKACAITRDAFIRILKTIRPGMGEYEIEAEIIHEFIRQRATGHAYSPIIASGKNACILHYTDNNQLIEKGSLVLMDFGAEYANYAADLSRTIPASGRFSERQKVVYQACLNVQKEAIQMLRPGITLTDYNAEVGKVMESELIRIGLIDKKDAQNAPADRPAYKRYFMHGTAHFLGLDVHDVGSRYEPMQAGNLFTCEPGIYIPEEQIGIRIENNILITDNGPYDLMADTPSEIEEIEEIMNTR